MDERWSLRHTLRIERPAYFEAECVLRILKMAAVGASAYCVLRIAYRMVGCGCNCVLRIAYCVLDRRLWMELRIAYCVLRIPY